MKGPSVSRRRLSAHGSGPHLSAPEMRRLPAGGESEHGFLELLQEAGARRWAVSRRISVHEGPDPMATGMGPRGDCEAPQCQLLPPSEAGHLPTRAGPEASARALSATGSTGLLVSRPQAGVLQSLVEAAGVRCRGTASRELKTNCLFNLEI